MKKLLLQILFLLVVLPSISQNFVHISGTVTDLGTGNPIANQAVTISNDSTGGWFYSHTVYTYSDGYYIDTVPVPLNTGGNLYVRTIDCQNFLHEVVVTFNPTQLNFTVNFSICYNSNPCQANFTSLQQLPLTVQYTDASVGGGTTRLWNFGDGATSTDPNPLHVYTYPGYYNVSLTIGALGTTCYNTSTQTINVWDSIGGGGCQAAFTVIPDSSNNTATYHFIDQSQGNINSWAWNFGDPGSGANNTSTLENPTHTYSQPGTYTACLTIHGVDTTCYDMTCMTILVSNNSNCNAEFTYYADTLNTLNTIHFVDLSTAGTGYLSTWVWYFGDGQVQTVSFPGNPNVDHTYAQEGIYTACLKVYGSDSTCNDMTCHTIIIGNPSPCQAAFTSYADSLNAGQTIHFIDQSAGNIVTWSWNFGDGTSSVEQNPVHTYAASGYYAVTLTVGSPNQSCFSTITDTIYVGPYTGCLANFTYTSVAPNFTTLSFSDLSTGNPTSWFWSFGDGTSASIQNPLHTFAALGTYNVCLTITSINCTSTFCMNVLVQDSTNFHPVYGQVFTGNFPLTMGLAMIFSVDTTANYQPFVAVSPIDSNGVYYFAMVPEGNYYILAIPFDSNSYLPTYYGNTISWEDATLVTLGTPNNPYNINLVIPSPMTPGPGSTSGLINTGDVPASMVDKINMIIMNEQGNPIGFTRVSTSGTFSFPSLAYGTYYLHAEMPGITSDQVKVILTAATPHADVVMTFSGKSILGIRDVVSLANSWSVYPNPVADNLTISIDMKQGSDVTVEIFNLAGQLVQSRQATLNAGKGIIGMPVAVLPFGIYTVQVNSPNGVVLTSRIIKTR